MLFPEEVVVELRVRRNEFCKVVEYDVLRLRLQVCIEGSKGESDVNLILYDFELFLKALGSSFSKILWNLSFAHNKHSFKLKIRT